jgi:hypothetical protein
MAREARRKTFILPGSQGTMICKNAIARLLGYGKYALKSLFHCAKNGIDPVHGLRNKKGNATTPFDFNGMMKTFFDDLSLLAAPRATRIVVAIVNGEPREELRDTDEMLSELPPSFTWLVAETRCKRSDSQHDKRRPCH